MYFEYCAKIITIEEHREKFEAKVLEMQEKKGKNSRMLTKDHYDQTVRRLKMLENVGEERQLADYNLMRRFALLSIEVLEGIHMLLCLVEKQLLD